MGPIGEKRINSVMKLRHECQMQQPQFNFQSRYKKLVEAMNLQETHISETWKMRKSQQMLEDGLNLITST
jgi:hypothetical protein